ncbi:hypothetical protein HGRIS_001635 [Hohenbuehelia grisea]|uniref:Uncharacterized protein n=1 Tax=Hohenbuehelia grisea TaxID=104357 RepID=A0ABR3JJ92_9AGAR
MQPQGYRATSLEHSIPSGQGPFKKSQLIRLAHDEIKRRQINHKGSDIGNDSGDDDESGDDDDDQRQSKSKGKSKSKALSIDTAPRLRSTRSLTIGPPIATSSTEVSQETNSPLSTLAALKSGPPIAASSTEVSQETNSPSSTLAALTSGPPIPTSSEAMAQSNPRTRVILAAVSVPLACLLFTGVGIFLFRRRYKARKEAQRAPPLEAIDPFVTSIPLAQGAPEDASNTSTSDDEKVLLHRQSLTRQRVEMEAELAQLQRSASSLSRSAERSGSEVQEESLAASRSEPASAEMNRKIAWMMARIVELEARMETPMPPSPTPPPSYVRTDRTLLPWFRICLESFIYSFRAFSES